MGLRRRGGRGRPLGGRRVPAARSLAPTLLNGFLGLAVYLSFVFASVAQLPHRTLTAAFLGFSAARGGSWTCAPAQGLGAPSPALGHPAGRAAEHPGPAFPARPRVRFVVRMAQEWRGWERGSLPPPATLPGRAAALGAPLPRATLAPPAPRGHVKCWELTVGETRAPGPSHPLAPGGLPSGQSREYR